MRKTALKDIGKQEVPAAASAATARVLLVDDHAVVRQGLKQILQEAFPQQKYGEAGDFNQALALLQKQKWDLLVLDLTLPGPSGLDLLKEMRMQGLKVPTLVLSVHSEEQYAIRALRGGAAGYLCKSAAPQEFVGAVERILGGHCYLSATVTERLAQAVRGPRNKVGLERLSDRELEVLRLIGMGRSVKQIGEQLNLSVKTISTYRARLLVKLEVDTTAHLMRYAMDEGLVE